MFNGDHKLVEYLMRCRSRDIHSPPSPQGPMEKFYLRGARHRADVNVAADDDTTPLHAAMNFMESWSAQRGFMGLFCGYMEGMEWWDGESTKMHESPIVITLW